MQIDRWDTRRNLKTTQYLQPTQQCSQCKMSESHPHIVQKNSSGSTTILSSHSDHCCKWSKMTTQMTQSAQLRMLSTKMTQSLHTCSSQRGVGARNQMDR
eukprot:COSAG02_NODE_1714_length_11220_cov_3.198543_6_plen_100_part_00